MSSPNISTYRRDHSVDLLVVDPRHPQVRRLGEDRIHGAGQRRDRIKQQASQLSVTKVQNWSRRALFTSEAGGTFRDGDFHAYLRQMGVERELKPERTEWHHFDGAAKSSIDYFNSFRRPGLHRSSSGRQDDYDLRPEQKAAIEQALTVFNEGGTEVLWNAKPRFGKTLTTYDLDAPDRSQEGAHRHQPASDRQLVVRRLHQLHRHQTTYMFVSDSPSLASRSA